MTSLTMNERYEVQEFFHVVKPFLSNKIIGVFVNLPSLKYACEAKQATDNGILLKWEESEGVTYGMRYDKTCVYVVEAYPCNRLIEFTAEAIAPSLEGVFK